MSRGGLLAEAPRVWVESPVSIRVAEDDKGRLIGTYEIKPNQPGLGALIDRFRLREELTVEIDVTELCPHYSDGRVFLCVPSFSRSVK